MTQLIPYEPKHLIRLFEWAKTPEDLHAFAATSFEYPLRKEQFSDYPACFNAHAFWLTEENEAIGFGDIVRDDSRQEYRLARIIVAPEKRGQGYGKLLTKHLVHEAQRLLPNSNWKICLWVLAENPISQKTYLKVGFKLGEERIEFKAGGKVYPCIKMIYRHEKS